MEVWRFFYEHKTAIIVWIGLPHPTQQVKFFLSESNDHYNLHQAVLPNWMSSTTHEVFITTLFLKGSATLWEYIMAFIFDGNNWGKNGFHSIVHVITARRCVGVCMSFP
jgi:hypothetical protein